MDSGEQLKNKYFLPKKMHLGTKSTESKTSLYIAYNGHGDRKHLPFILVSEHVTLLSLRCNMWAESYNFPDLFYWLLHLEHVKYYIILKLQKLRAGPSVCDKITELMLLKDHLTL